MWKYILKRIGLAVVTAFIILSLTFIFMKMLKPERFVGTYSQRMAFYTSQEHSGYLVSTKTPREGETYVEKLTSKAGEETGRYIAIRYRVPKEVS